MADTILNERAGDITRITINQPENGNRMSNPMAQELADMMDEAAKDSRLILLQGAGADFCLGRAQMGARGEVQEAYVVRGNTEVIFNVYGAFRRSQVPVVGAVRGRAVGFGCALAALCDITIASDNSRFQFPEMAHNIMPTLAMSALVDRMALKAIMYMIYSTAEVDAPNAMAWGLASRVVPDRELESAVDELVAALEKSPMPAVMAVKEYARSAVTMHTEAANSFARNLHATVNSYSGMHEKKE